MWILSNDNNILDWKISSYIWEIYVCNDLGVFRKIDEYWNGVG